VDITTVPESGSKKTQIPLLRLLADRMEGMPPVQKRIGRYLLENPQAVVRMSISHLAEKTGAKSEASIVKFYRSLGFSGYHDFKVTLAGEIAGRAISGVDENSEITLDDDIGSLKKKIFQSGLRVLQKNMEVLDDGLIRRTVDLLLAAKRIILLGYGTSVVVAYDGFIKFSRLGLHCLYTTDSHVNALVLSELREGDLLFCVSSSGESKDVVIPVAGCKPRAVVVAMTGSADSPLGKLADVCLVVDSRETNYRTDAMVSRIAEIALMDTIFSGLVVSMGPEALDRLASSRQGLSYLKF